MSFSAESVIVIAVAGFETFEGVTNYSEFKGHWDCVLMNFEIAILKFPEFYDFHTDILDF